MWLRNEERKGDKVIELASCTSSAEFWNRENNLFLW